MLFITIIYALTISLVYLSPNKERINLVTNKHPPSVVNSGSSDLYDCFLTRKTRPFYIYDEYMVDKFRLQARMISPCMPIQCAYFPQREIAILLLPAFSQRKMSKQGAILQVYLPFLTIAIYCLNRNKIMNLSNASKSFE